MSISGDSEHWDSFSEHGGSVDIEEDFSCSESCGLVEFLSEDQRLKKAVHSAISTRLARCKCNV